MKSKAELESPTRQELRLSDPKKQQSEVIVGPLSDPELSPTFLFPRYKPGISWAGSRQATDTVQNCNWYYLRGYFITVVLLLLRIAL